MGREMSCPIIAHYFGESLTHQQTDNTFIYGRMKESKKHWERKIWNMDIQHNMQTAIDNRQSTIPAHNRTDMIVHFYLKGVVHILLCTYILWWFCSTRYGECITQRICHVKRNGFLVCVCVDIFFSWGLFCCYFFLYLVLYFFLSFFSIFFFYLKTILFWLCTELTILLADQFNGSCNRNDFLSRTCGIFTFTRIHDMNIYCYIFISSIRRKLLINSGNSQ